MDAANGGFGRMGIGSNLDFVADCGPVRTLGCQYNSVFSVIRSLERNHHDHNVLDAIRQSPIPALLPVVGRVRSLAQHGG